MTDIFLACAIMFYTLAVLSSGHWLDGQIGYLKRWRLVPKNRWCNICLHKICSPDTSLYAHDHPWAYFSLVLKGTFKEEISEFRQADVKVDDRLICDTSPARRYRLIAKSFYERRPFSMTMRKAEYAHIIHALKGWPVWTLVVTGRKVRPWGWYLPVAHGFSREGRIYKHVAFCTMTEKQKEQLTKYEIL